MQEAPALDDLVSQGIQLAGAGQMEEAEKLFSTALLHLPGDAEALENCGKVVAQQGRELEAIGLLERAVKINPLAYGAWCLLGAMYGTVGRFTEGISALDRCLTLAPDLPAARWNRAHQLLTIGHWRQGWTDYQYGFINRMRFPRSIKPKWDGRAIPGQRLLIHSEQGYGDTIWALRLLGLAKTQANCHVILEVQEALFTLCLSSDLPADEIYPQKRDLHCHFDFDVHCSLMDLPYILGIDVHTVLSQEPYLMPSRVLTDAWKGEAMGKTGLVWKGSATHSNDKRRSMPKERLLPLEGRTDFLSLQREDTAPFPMSEIGGDLHDFAVTAAVIEGLDRVVTVDTSVAHLSAAMGKPTALMIPDIIDFRWLRDRADCPWYPSMRLFRQKKQGDWTPVVEEVGEWLTI